MNLNSGIATVTGEYTSFMMRSISSDDGRNFFGLGVHICGETSPT